MSRLAEWLRAQMKAHNKLSQRGLQKYSGVSKGQIGRILKGDYTPGPEDLLRLAAWAKFDPLTLVAIAYGLDISDGNKLHPSIKSLTRTVESLDLSFQEAIGESWAKNLDLAIKMLEEGRREQAQERSRSE